MHVKRNAKEVLRHLLLRSGLNGAYLAFRSARGQNMDHLRARTLRERFSTIYRNRVWLTGRPYGSLSGLGSELENTKAIRRRLPELLARLHTKTILDVGCGDFNWMSRLELDCRYIGVDVASSVIEQNIRNYGSVNRTFYDLDATTDPLPSADTILCREVFFHLSFADIWALIRNMRLSGVSTMIATNDAGTDFNADILSGDFRLLNLTKPPFCFPRSQLFIPDDEVSPGRMLAAWRLSDVPQHGSPETRGNATPQSCWRTHFRAGK
jgi:SAM-dependent methyltransferase